MYDSYSCTCTFIFHFLQHESHPLIRGPLALCILVYAILQRFSILVIAISCPHIIITEASPNAKAENAS